MSKMSSKLWSFPNHSFWLKSSSCWLYSCIDLPLLLMRTCQGLHNIEQVCDWENSFLSPFVHRVYCSLLVYISKQVLPQGLHQFWLHTIKDLDIESCNYICIVRVQECLFSFYLSSSAQVATSIQVCLLAELNNNSCQNCGHQLFTDSLKLEGISLDTVFSCLYTPGPLSYSTRPGQGYLWMMTCGKTLSTPALY